MINNELIASKIYTIRSQKVMLDRDLAELYQVETKNLNKAVKRNIKRFPPEFMFELSEEEYTNLKFQIGTSSSHGGRRKLPKAFTEEGIAMLSGILHSDRAITVNVQIMKLFMAMRRLLSSNTDLLFKLQEIEKHLLEHDESIDTIIQYLHQFKTKSNPPRKEIGFKQKK